MLQYSRSVINNLMGVVTELQGTEEAIVDGPLALLFSSFFNISASGSYSLALNGGELDLSDLLASYIQNTSLSLLSGEIFASNDTSTILIATVDSPCTHSSIAYEYFPAALLLSYGMTALVVAVCVLMGFWAIRKNGVEESMDVSRVMYSILNRELFDARQTIGLDTMVRLKGDKFGHFVPEPEDGH